MKPAASAALVLDLMMVALVVGSTGRPSRAQSEPTLDRSSLVEDTRQLSDLLEASHPDPYLRGGGKIAYVRRLHELLRSFPDRGITRTELYRRLLPFVAAVGDGHTRLIPPFTRDPQSPGGLPLEFAVIEDRLVLVAVADERRTDLIGSTLQAVEGVGLATIEARYANLYPVENRYQLLGALAGVGALWWRSDLELLVPEWKDQRTVSVELRRPGGKVETSSIPVPASIDGPLHRPASTIELPDTEKCGFGTGFLDPSGQTAILVVDHMSGYRERFEILRSLGRTDLRTAAEGYYRRWNGTDPPASTDAVLAGLPSAAEEFLSLLTTMKTTGSKNLVVDLRRDDGGSSAMAEILVYFLYGEATLRAVWSRSNEVTRYSVLYFDLHPDESIDRTDRNRTVASATGDYDFSRDHRFTGPWSASQLQRMFDDRIHSMPSFERLVLTGKYGGFFTPSQVTVLVSPRTFSAGYTLMRYLHLAGAVLIGTPSGQAGNAFGSILEFELKHSALKGYVSHKYYEDFPRDPVKGQLLRPDFVMPYSRFLDYRADPNAEVRYALELMSSGRIQKGGAPP